MTGLHIVWFRQDLRLHDHAALKAASIAAERDGGCVLALYLADGGDNQGLLSAALRDLDAALAQRGASLHLRSGDVCDVLTKIHAAHGILSLHTHETLTDRAQEKAVAAWSMRAGLPFRVHAQFGPAGARRNDIAAWERFMAAPRHEGPAQIASRDIGVGARAYLAAAEGSENAAGGRRAAITLLRAALGQVADIDAIATPDANSGAQIFAALRPHLELGVLSVREVWQAAMRARQHFLKAGHDIRAARMAGLIERLPKLRPEGAQPGLDPAGTARTNRIGARDKGASQLSLDIFSDRAPAPDRPQNRA